MPVDTCARVPELVWSLFFIKYLLCTNNKILAAYDANEGRLIGDAERSMTSRVEFETSDISLIKLKAKEAKQPPEGQKEELDNWLTAQPPRSEKVHNFFKEAEKTAAHEGQCP